MLSAVSMAFSNAHVTMMEKMINNYYYSNSYRIQDDGTVFNAKKNAVLDSTMVEQRRGRWRFGLI